MSRRKFPEPIDSVAARNRRVRPVRVTRMDFLEITAADDLGRTALGAEARYLLRTHWRHAPQKYRASLIRRGLSAASLDRLLAAYGGQVSAR